MEKLISVPDLFKKSFELYKPRIWTMLLLGLVGWIVSIAIIALFGLAGFATLLGGRGIPTFNLITILLFLIGLLLLIIVNVWVQVALIYSIKDEHVKAKVKDLLMTVRDKMASYYWIIFLRGLVVLAGCILLIIPGIIFSIWFCLSQYVFVFEGVRGRKALGRSRELVRGYWWPVLGRLLLLGIVAVLVSSISRLGFLINSLFTVPFGIAYIYIIYEDLKRLKRAQA